MSAGEIVALGSCDGEIETLSCEVAVTPDPPPPHVPFFLLQNQIIIGAEGGYSGFGSPHTLPSGVPANTHGGFTPGGAGSIVTTNPGGNHHGTPGTGHAGGQVSVIIT